LSFTHLHPCRHFTTHLAFPFCPKVPHRAIGPLPFEGLAANGSLPVYGGPSSSSLMGVGGEMLEVKGLLNARRCRKSTDVEDPRILCRPLEIGAGRSLTNSSTGAVCSRCCSSRLANVASSTMVEMPLSSIWAKNPIWSMRTPAAWHEQNVQDAQGRVD
jgi:hypothetical protein